MAKTLAFAALVGVALAAAPTPTIKNSTLTYGPSVYTAGPVRAVWEGGYYGDPTATAAEPQPKVSDPVTGKIYSLNLTAPVYYPHNNTVDPVYLPLVPAPNHLHDIFIAQLSSIIDAPSSTYGGSCGKCVAGLQVGQTIALTRPELAVGIMLELCNKYKFSTKCEDTYSGTSYGGVITQVLANANVGGYDGQAICNQFISSSCPLPALSPLNLTGWFKTPKPANAVAPVPPVGGKRLKVLHISDFHLDPRYEIGSEGNCTGAGSLCCRHGVFNPTSPSQVLLPAPRYGTFQCDTPWDLALAALESIPILTDTQKKAFDFTLYTGDLVSHDLNQQLDRDYVAYTQTVSYTLFKKLLNAGPVYAALGNHDSSPQAQDGPHLFPNTPSTYLSEQFSFNYEHVSKLWEYEGWVNHDVGQKARAHYGGYSVKRHDGLRIITINTDFCEYKSNYFNYIGMTTSDPGGNLRFLTDELQAAEEAGERVWIFGHVLTGWDGTNPLQNPTNLFYQIVDRFSPHVIAAIFFGHTHEDQFMIYYANNATTINANTAQTVGWIGPSLTPLTNLNSGFRVYEVDEATFSVMDAHTWYANVSQFHDLDAISTHGPTYQYEYSTRETYGGNIAWPVDAPLNATWWHKVTEQMESNHSLVQTFTVNQGKHSVRSPPCLTDECVTSKICYMRSGSVPIAKQNCKTGYGSVQSGG